MIRELWLRFDERVGVWAMFRCKDHASAEAVQALLVKNELAESEAVRVREDVLVTMQTQTTPERVRQLMKRWSGGMPGFRFR